MYVVKVLIVSISPRVKVKVLTIAWKALRVLALVCLSKLSPCSSHHFVIPSHSRLLADCSKNSISRLLFQDSAPAGSPFCIYQCALLPISFPLLSEAQPKTAL